MPTNLGKCGTSIKQRWITVLLGFLGLFNFYHMRICLSITITEMTIQANKTIQNSNEHCFAAVNETLHSKNKNWTRTLFAWSEYEQGIILSSFYWGYILTNLPGGMIAERFGSKYTLGLGLLISAILTSLTPFVVNKGGSFALIILRILIGMASGPTYPAITVLLSQWIPANDRSKAASIVYAGASLGTIFALTASGIILKISLGNWALVFYFFGGVGILSFLLNTLFCYSKPSQSPFISNSELQYLKQNLKISNTVVHRTPWKHILTSKPVWALIVASIGNTWGFVTIISDLPKFLKSVLHLPVDMNGYMTSVPLLSKSVVGGLISIIADKMISTGKLSTTRVRKIGSSIASLGPGTFLVFAAYSGCNYILIVIFLIIGHTLLGAATSSILVNSLDLGPNCAGVLMGVANGISNLTGMFAPYIAGLLTPNQTVQEWQYVFWIVLIIFVITNTIFLILGSGEVQKWNNYDTSTNNEKTKNILVKDEIELLQIGTELKRPFLKSKMNQL